MTQPPPLHYETPQKEPGGGCRHAAEFIAGNVCGAIIFVILCVIVGSTLGQHVSGKTLLIVVFAASAIALVGGLQFMTSQMFVGGLLIGFCVVSLLTGLCFAAIS